MVTSIFSQFIARPIPTRRSLVMDGTAGGRTVSTPPPVHGTAEERLLMGMLAADGALLTHSAPTSILPSRFQGVRVRPFPASWARPSRPTPALPWSNPVLAERCSATATVAASLRLRIAMPTVAMCTRTATRDPRRLGWRSPRRLVWGCRAAAAAWVASLAAPSGATHTAAVHGVVAVTLIDFFF